MPGGPLGHGRHGGGSRCAWIGHVWLGEVPGWPGCPAGPELPGFPGCPDGPRGPGGPGILKIKYLKVKITNYKTNYKNTLQL